MRGALLRPRGVSWAVLFGAVAVGSAACSKSSSGPPAIQVAVLTFPPGHNPTGHHSAAAAVVDTTSREQLDGAAVLINHSTLTFQRSSGLYRGDVDLAPGEQVNVTVTLEGKTYSGSAQQFADYPSVQSPTAREALHQNVPSLIQWDIGTTSVSTSGAGLQYPLLAVLDAASPDGDFVWPVGNPDFFQPGVGTAFRIDASLSPGGRIVVVGKEAFFTMEGATGVSSITVGAFGGQAITVSTGALTSLEIEPSPPTFPYRVGRAGALTAMGHFSDGTLQNLTDQVVWSTEDSSVATVELGYVVASSEGVTNVTASYGGVSTTAELTITPPVVLAMDVGPVTIAPNLIVVNRLVPLPLSAHGEDLDGTRYDVTNRATWTSSDSTIATVSDSPGSKGQVTGVAPGTVSIQATVGAVDAGVELTVSEWAARDAGTSDTFTAVVWSGTQFVAVGATQFGPGTVPVFTSPDGLVWTAQDAGVFGRLLRVVSSGRQLLALGDAVAVVSSDGVSWSAHSLPNSLEDAAWSGTRWAAVGPSGIESSEDGASWTPRNSWVVDTVAWMGSQFVALGAGGVVTSPDGLDWTVRSYTGPVVKAVATSGDRLVAVWDQTLATSTDGLSWTTVAPPYGVLPEAIAWNGHQWFAVGANATVVATSPDGTTWTGQPLGAASLTGVASSGARDVAVGWNGTVLTRP